MLKNWFSSAAALACMAGCATAAAAAKFVGRIVDADSNQPIAARVYVENAAGEWLFVESADENGSALPYREQWVPSPGAIELHTTVSAHPFRMELPQGDYTISIERGKEHLPLTEKLSIGASDVRRTFRLERFVNMAERGWYSGETHVHRRLEELPNVMLAEELNVAFPVTFWTIDAFSAPGLAPSPLRRQGPSPFGPRTDAGTEMIAIDRSHVIFPRNTEYEIFNIRGERNVLGAVFILNHKTAFQDGMPPVAPIAEQAHREGALLDLDKHSWPWSMMLIPIAKVDLYELSNNSIWRTNFRFRRTQVEPAAYMKVEMDERGMTEWGWLQFGFENYYTLLNCGFRLAPSAGTASGVHPVPLGYSRVYVHTGERFDPQQWLDGLRRGRSFVTTGPMLLATLDEKLPGHYFEQPEATAVERTLRIESISERPVDRIEIVVNGRLWKTLRPAEEGVRAADGGYHFEREVRAPIAESSWLIVRSFQVGEEGRVRFAHTAPWHIEIAGQPVRPRREEIDFLIRRVRDEMERNEPLLPEAALDEFRQALRVYEEIGERAIDE